MRTVFVIGAGANAEIGMPVGDELKTRIASVLKFTETERGALSGDDIICGALDLYSRNPIGIFNSMRANVLVKAAMDISKAMSLSISIDNFIDARRGDQEIAFCGKLAIVHTIRVAEHYCKLFESKAEYLNDTWYPLFFQKITEGCHVDELDARFDDISFIIFNYDRCFEYFIYLSLMVYYSIDHNRAKNIVQSLHINHPYGTAGELWDDMGNLTFGETPNPRQLISLAQNIKTFTESIEQKNDSNKGIRYLVKQADRIIFLGFAYHDQNLNLLFKYHPSLLSKSSLNLLSEFFLDLLSKFLGSIYVFKNISFSKKITCFGTGHGMSDKDLDHLREILQKKCKKIRNCDISQMTCSQFFRDFWYRLTFKST
jgi:hypothetical protein